MGLNHLETADRSAQNHPTPALWTNESTMPPSAIWLHGVQGGTAPHPRLEFNQQPTTNKKSIVPPTARRSHVGVLAGRPLQNYLDQAPEHGCLLGEPCGRRHPALANKKRQPIWYEQMASGTQATGVGTSPPFPKHEVASGPAQRWP